MKNRQTSTTTSCNSTKILHLGQKLQVHKRSKQHQHTPLTSTSSCVCWCKSDLSHFTERKVSCATEYDNISPYLEYDQMNVLNVLDEQLHLRKYNIMPEELSPLQLVQRYQNNFPLCAFVSKGFYGSNERFTLSEGDVYNIHLVK